ncbi:MAG: hypothetical protein IJ917_03455 [Firmicutes bacterium]|nr:hypothetical protein [Bacillota bacterium]
MEKVTAKLLRGQKLARSNAQIYKQLAKETKDKKRRKALLKLAADEKKMAGTLKGIAGMKAKPNFLLVRFKKALYRGLNIRDFYNLTELKRRIHAKRYASLASAQAGILPVKPKFQKKLSASVAKAQTHMGLLKKQS